MSLMLLTRALRTALLVTYQPKRALGRNIVDLYHSEGEGLKAQAALMLSSKDNRVPKKMCKEVAISLEADEDGLIYLPKILVE